jgi:hypothetical protein
MLPAANTRTSPTPITNRLTMTSSRSPTVAIVSAARRARAGAVMRPQQPFAAEAEADERGDQQQHREHAALGELAPQTLRPGGELAGEARHRRPPAATNGRRTSSTRRAM